MGSPTLPPRHLRTSLARTAQVISGNSGLVFGALRKLRWPQCNSFLLQTWTEPGKAEWPRGGYATASPLPCVVCRARSRLPATRTDQERLRGSPRATKLRRHSPACSQFTGWPSSPHFTGEETEAQRSNTWFKVNVNLRWEFAFWKWERELNWRLNQCKNHQMEVLG